MSIERSRFSGTASIYNRLNQLLFAIKFWLYTAIVVALVIFIWRIYPIAKVKGIADFFLRTSAYEFTLKTGQPWPWLLRNVYRSAVVEQTSEYHDYYRYIFNVVKRAGYEGLAGGVLILVIGFWMGRREALSQTEDRHRRGSQLVPPKQLNRCLRKTEGDGQIQLGEIHLPCPIEVRGMFAVGMLGVGKTQLQNRIMDTIVERDERGIIFSVKGDDFLSTH